MATDLLGFGQAPFGAAFFGYGEPATADKRAENLGVRYFNPTTGDFEILEDGSFAEMPAVRQRVIMILLTTLGSAEAEGLTNIGTNIRAIKKITQSTPRQVYNAVREALHQMASVEGSISLDNVLVNETQAGRVQIIVSYTDLTGQDNDDINLTF